MVVGGLALAGCRPPQAAAPEPAGAIEVEIPGDGAAMRATLYLDDRAERLPLVLYLHGYPGPRHTADLGEALRRAGFRVIELHARGMHGSGGIFSFGGGLADVAAALAWARSPENAARYRLDPARVALVGHSYGGWQALLAAESAPPALCVAALAPWNLGWTGARYADRPGQRDADLAEFHATTRRAVAPVHADPQALVDELAAHAAEWDYVARAARLGDRALLLVGATRDTPDEDPAMLDRLAAAARAAGATRVRREDFDDDHGFSAHRAALADLLTRWLEGDCAATWPAGAAR